MSIVIPQPSMALNSESIDKWGTPFGAVSVFKTYSMWNTWPVAWNTPVEHIIDNVAAVAESAPDHYLRVVILNAHGSAANIGLGQKIQRVTPSFARWRGKVANIWVIACKVAKIDPPRPNTPPDWDDGNLFCSALARTTGAYVVASTESQDHPLASLPWGHVNEWNGLVLRYEPDHGSVDWHRRYERGALQAPPPPIAVPARLNQKPWWQWPAPRGRRRLAG